MPSTLGDANNNSDVIDSRERFSSKTNLSQGGSSHILYPQDGSSHIPYPRPVSSQPRHVNQPISDRLNEMVDGGKETLTKSDEDKKKEGKDEEDQEEEEEEEDGTCYGWLIVGASFFSSMITEGVSFSFGVIFAELIKVFNRSSSETVWVGALFMSMPLLLSPVSSAMTNRFGCRRTTVAGSLIAAVGCYASAYADSIWVLCITYGLIAGFGIAMIIVPSMVVVAFNFKKRRALATGISVAGTGLGMLVFAPLTELLIQRCKLKTTFKITSGFMLLVIISGLIFRTPKPRHLSTISLWTETTKRNHDDRHVTQSAHPVTSPPESETRADASPSIAAAVVAARSSSPASVASKTVASTTAAVTLTTASQGTVASATQSAAFARIAASTAILPGDGTVAEKEPQYVLSCGGHTPPVITASEKFPRVIDDDVREDARREVGRDFVFRNSGNGGRSVYLDNNVTHSLIEFPTYMRREMLDSSRVASDIDHNDILPKEQSRTEHTNSGTLEGHHRGVDQDEGSRAFLADGTTPGLSALAPAVRRVSGDGRAMDLGVKGQPVKRLFTFTKTREQSAYPRRLSRARAAVDLTSIRKQTAVAAMRCGYILTYRRDIFYRGTLVKANILERNAGLFVDCRPARSREKRVRAKVGISGRKESKELPETKGQKEVSLLNVEYDEEGNNHHVELEDEGDDEEDEEVKATCCSGVIDISIFHHAVFILFCAHCFVLFFGYNVPFVFMPDKATSLGLPSFELKGSILISVIGASSTIGQILMGYVGDLPSVRPLYLYLATCIVAGLVTLFVPLLTSYSSLVVYCSFYGFFSSGNYALTTIILVEMLDMDRLTFAFGISSMASGLAPLIGLPCAGYLFDVTGSYDATFFVSGSSMIFSGLMLFAYPCVYRRFDAPYAHGETRTPL